MYLVDCEWGSFSEWSPCSKSCGGGEKSRTRQVATPASNGGLSCEGEPIETEGCNTEGCPVNCKWGAYEPWSSCSKTCGGGEKMRTRQVDTHASNGGQACEGNATETEVCNTDGCPINCEWGPYGEWSSCSQSCGGGTRSKTRSKLVEESIDGSCSGDAAITEECNTDNCQTGKNIFVFIKYEIVS